MGGGVKKLKVGFVYEKTPQTNKTEREANLFAAEILLTDKETLSVMSYASAMEEAAFELGVVPQILSYKLELLNHKGHHFNITDTASDFLK